MNGPNAVTAKQMSATITLDLQVMPDANKKNIPKKQQMQDWASRALSIENRDSAELCIRVVGKAESQSLNRQYRGKDKPTNILSFPCQLPEDVNLSLLGDLVVCESVVTEEAAAQNKTLAAHWAHMIIHGTLHLLGYDHELESQAQIMEGLEIELLRELGIANPYQIA